MINVFPNKAAAASRQAWTEYLDQHRSEAEKAKDHAAKSWLGKLLNVEAKGMANVYWISFISAALYGS